MRIFVSYAHVDWQFVENLARRLARYHDVWYDDRLHAGQDWWQTILQRLEWCECFIYVLSPESLESKYCLQEYGEARQLEKAIIPVRLQPNIELPDALARIQYVDFVTRIFEDALADLFGDLGALAERLRRAARSQPVIPPAPPPPTIVTDLDVVTTFREAVEARRSHDYETALRLLNTLREEAPDFLSDQVDTLIADSAQTLSVLARRKEYVRVYQQVSLLALDDLTMDDARRMWVDLLRKFPDITHDPENMAARLAVTPESSDILKILPPPFEWAYVPGGEVTLITERGWGENYIPAGSSQTFRLDPFLMTRHPITNAQYEVFVHAEDGFRDEGWWDYAPDAQRWRRDNPTPWDMASPGGPEHPRVFVTWFEAVAFCRWLSSQLDYRVRLPTEQEWQRAAQGDDGRKYPWGNEEPDESRANWKRAIDGTTPVGHYPDGASPFGLLDMAGNVWEWCVTDVEHGSSDISRPANYRVLRGGSWSNLSTSALRVTLRYRFGPPFEVNNFGFRCVRAYVE